MFIQWIKVLRDKPVNKKLVLNLSWFSHFYSTDFQLPLQAVGMSGERREGLGKDFGI